MRSARYWIRFISTFISRFKGILFIGLVSGILIFVFFFVVYPAFFGNKTEYIGLAGRYQADNLHPEIQNLIGEGLTKVNDDGTVVQALASSWESTDKGKVWVFKLDTNKKWQDGTIVDSETVQYSFNDVQVETPDKNTIVFKLENEYAAFPSVVSKPAFKKGLLGTGEWKVKNLKLSGSYVSEVVLVNSERDRKIFRIYPSEDQAKTAYKLGEVDSLIDILEPRPLSEWGVSSVTENINQGRYVAIFFNNEDPFLGGSEAKPLRQALSYAIDKDALGTPRALGPISPQSWAYNSKVKEYQYDQERAKELIEDNLSEEIKKNLEIKLATIPALLDVAEAIASKWREAGVNTIVQVAPALPAEYQAFLAIYDIPKDPDQYSTWHSTQIGTTNISRYSNPRIDTLLESGRQELDTEERKRIYLDFQRFLLEDAPAIFLYHPVSYTINRK